MFKIVSRKSMINVRLAEQTHEDFKIVAELRGASMSTLLHQFIVKAVREEKERDPQAFNRATKEEHNASILKQNTPVLREVEYEHLEIEGVVGNKGDYERKAS